MLEVEENKIISSEKSFNERLSEWRKKHPITKEELDAIDRKRSVNSLEPLKDAAVSQNIDINGYPEETAFQEWANEMLISKEEANEIYRQRDPARASEFFSDCDEDSVDFTNIHSMLLSGNVDERFL